MSKAKRKKKKSKWQRTFGGRTLKRSKLEIVALGDDGYHVFCKARLDGKKIRALIDTGASKTIIAARFANNMASKNFVEVTHNETSGIGPDLLQPEFIEVNEISFGKSKVKNHVVGVLDMTHVVSMYEKMKIKPFDLLVGSDILLELGAIIDYGSRRLYVNAHK